jgi:hypothetical protein
MDAHGLLFIGLKRVVLAINYPIIQNYPGIFIAELTPLFVTLQHIGEVINPTGLRM